MSVRTVATLALSLVNAVAGAADLLPPRLVDANGAVLGRVTTSLTTPLGAFYDTTGQGDLAFIGMIATPHAKSQTFDFPSQADLYYATSDCSGPAWFPDSARLGALASVVLVTATKTLLYVADGFETDASDFVSKSRLRPGGCSLGKRHVANFYKASSPPIDLSAFAPPFAVK
jgi:hypothetical protein